MILPSGPSSSNSKILHVIWCLTVKQSFNCVLYSLITSNPSQILPFSASSSSLSLITLTKLLYPYNVRNGKEKQEFKSSFDSLGLICMVLELFRWSRIESEDSKIQNINNHNLYTLISISHGEFHPIQVLCLEGFAIL